MPSIKCFDVADVVVQEADSQFGSLWEINKEKYEIFKQYCEAIDLLAVVHEGKGFEVSVDETLMIITVVMICEDFVLKDKDSIYYELVDRAIMYGFSADEDGYLLMKLTFPSVWDKKA